jgi:GNAT superfamily N-acetyltransferase
VPLTTIRFATADDIPAICHHRHYMFVDMGSDNDLTAHDAVFVLWLEAALASGEYLGFLAATDAGEIAGGAGLWLQEWPPRPNNPNIKRGYIMNVYVERDQRRKGIARQLITAVMDYCKANNRTIVTLHASEEGRPLYESLGFEPTNEMRIEF